MTTAAASADGPQRRRSTRMAAGSLARFRYREDDDSSDSDSGAKREEREVDDDDDDHKPSDDESSLSELSFNSDIEDAISAPRKKKATKATRAKATTRTTVAAAAAPTRYAGAGKRKRAATTTTTTTTTTVVTTLPTHKKRNGAVKLEDTLLEIKREIKSEEQDEPSKLASIRQKSASPRKVRKPARTITTKVLHSASGGEKEETHVEPPTDWELFYNLVKEMRQPGGPAANAAVDTMGCERLAMASASPRDRRFHTLVALMLSSQTKDTVNAVAMARLQSELPPHEPGAPAGLNLENMLAVDPTLLNQLIWQVGFHNNKTKYLKQAAVILRDQWGGDIPPTAEGLMALPGVGPKMAYLCLAAEHGWNRVEGIGVDVHVHRITNLWGWQKPGSAAAKTPEGTRLALQSWLPRDKWKEINWLLVGFGQAVCLPQGAKCGDCTLGLRGLCRAANRKKVADGRKKRKELGLEDLANGQDEDTAIKDEVKGEEDSD
ncbi:alpha,alpha-trehalase nth1 [Sporothrix curviconia]|uniref:Endonuclease III homolog n=1 Tax=Sporothrix curviconia TaxID=1260050 RepID=A0ABP0BTL2_9PEZI